MRNDISNISEAEKMIGAFAEVGAQKFSVTVTNVEREKIKFVNYKPHTFLKKLRGLLNEAEANFWNIIIRWLPVYNEGDDIGILQLDDLNLETFNKLKNIAFCGIETSPGNYQLFLAVCELGSEQTFSSIRRRLIAGVGADSGASGSARLAGSLNVKYSHWQANGSFPQVRLAHLQPGLLIKAWGLERLGLLAEDPYEMDENWFCIDEIPHKVSLPPRPPSYEKSLRSVKIKDDGELDRSAADLHFSICCLRWNPPIAPEAIAWLLNNESGKAASHPYPLWYIERTINRAISIVTREGNRNG
jgi:hypothetical protein